jgi:threonine dehydrogenase-like Zn-dependent dehydrogenase
LKALILEKPGTLVLADAPQPVPGPGELLIKTKSATICTSDLIDMKHNPFHIKLPVIMGHEGAGVVKAAGADVTDFQPGDEVTAHPVMPCGHCVSCRRGLRHLCDNMEHLGLNRGGVFAEYFVIRQDRVRKKPASLPFPQSTLMEPVCVCIEALERGNIQEGCNVLVLGDGPFGIMVTRLCQSYRPAKTILTGRHDFRLGMAPPGVITLNEQRSENITADVMKAVDNEGIDSAILCVASNQALDTAVSVLRSRGTVSVFAGTNGPASVDLFRLQVKELNICGSCNDMDYLDRALGLLCDPTLKLGEVITHVFSFEQWQEAFAQAENGKDSGLKVSIAFDT